MITFKVIINNHSKTIKSNIFKTINSHFKIINDHFIKAIKDQFDIVSVHYINSIEIILPVRPSYLKTYEKTYS